MKSYAKSNGSVHVLRKSALAACILAAGAPALGQDSSGGSNMALEEVVVTGMRQSLQNAQDIKRDADTFVDSVTASDIGSLPDRSVLEAMQRLPGVSIERFAAADDPDHFSVEGSGAVIRGMTATRSEFNGRDSFSANSGRGLSFQDVPPELMAGVDIYKNQSADMIEGGIGGTVSLRTRKPFDENGRVISVNADGTWGDLAEEFTPTYSAMFSDVWDTTAGEFGFLMNGASSELVGVSHGIQSDVYKKYPAADIPGAENFVGDDGAGTVWMPQGSNLTMKEDGREREGLATSFQWRDHDSKYLFTAEYIRSDSTLEWWENALKYQGGYTETDLNTRPYGESEFTFSENGLFQSGFLSDGNGAWRAQDDPNVNRIPNPWQTMPAGSVEKFGHVFQSDTRGSYHNSLVEDMSVNFRWTPTDALTVDVDYQRIEAENRVDDYVFMLGVPALQKYDLSGSTPHLELIEPWGGQRDDNPEAYADGYPGFSGDEAGDGNYFADEHSYFYRSAQGHHERSDGTSDALQLDATYSFYDSVITDVMAGVRWAEREQTIRNSGWGNWGSVAPEFSVGTLYLDQVPEQSDWYEVVDWSDFHRGGVLDIQGGNQLYHLTRDTVARHRDTALCEGDEGFITKSEGGSWIPPRCRDGLDSQFGIFAPNEISTTEETNKAAYVRLDFAFEDLPMRVAGNLGVRYVELDRAATGFVQSPSLDEDFTENEQLPSDLSAPLTGESVKAYAEEQVGAGNYSSLDEFYDAAENNWIGEAFWYLSDEERAYATTGSGPLTAETSYDAWLPSLNVKVEISDDLIGRFAASKAIAMPDMGDVRNNIDAGAEVTAYRGTPADQENAENWESAIQSAELTDLRGSGGNPYLMPMESNQFDASLEWYFSPVGSLTGTLFYKDLSNFFTNGASRQLVPNPATGSTQPVDVVSTRNGGTGEMSGFELAYQQFYDFLPEPWDGLGVQANYTWIEAEGVPNNEESYDEAGCVGGDTDTGARVNLDTIPLQGQSEHTANLVLMYEKNDWSARIAYNWRSKYLLTTRDVISKYPLWNDDAGFMDGSLFYDINDNVTVGLQATNLLNTQSETIMILDDAGTEAGRSWFVQDRRFSLVMRAQF